MRNMVKQVLFINLLHFLCRDLVKSFTEATHVSQLSTHVVVIFDSENFLPYCDIKLFQVNCNKFKRVTCGKMGCCRIQG